jgi:hypothetical protein
MNVITSTKQTVFSGVQTVKPYSNYIFQVEVKKSTVISIENIIIIEKENCFSVDYLIKSKSSASYLDKITSEGRYQVEAALRKGKFKESKLCNSKEDMAIIHYTENGKLKKVKIKIFKEEKKTRR